MKDEQIVLGDTDHKIICIVEQILLPDIRSYGLMISRRDQAVFDYAYRMAERILQSILQRTKNNCRKEHWKIHVPNLSFIIEQFWLKEEILEFDVVYRSLVRHFLPKAKAVPYSYNNKDIAGVIYKGWTWVADQVFQVE